MGWWDSIREGIESAWDWITYGPKKVVRKAGDWIDDHPYALAAVPLTPFAVTQIGVLLGGTAAAPNVVGTVPTIGVVGDSANAAILATAGAAGGASVAGLPFAPSNAWAHPEYTGWGSKLPSALFPTNGGGAGSAGFFDQITGFLGDVVDVGGKAIKAVADPLGNVAGQIGSASKSLQPSLVLLRDEIPRAASDGAKAVRNAVDEPGKGQIPIHWLIIAGIGIAVIASN